MDFSYRLNFSKTGRARFIAHLDTLSCLVRVIRRTGYELALTKGLRPKPVLSLAMPLGVGVEGEDEICDFSLKQRVPLTEFARKLNRELPEGMELKSVSPCFDRAKSAARVTSVSYRIELDRPFAGSKEAAAAYNRMEEMPLLRRRPKGDKMVDVKKYVDCVEASVDGRRITFSMDVTSSGTARPEEVMRALNEISGSDCGDYRIIRTSIALKEDTPPPPPGRARTGQRRKHRLKRH